MKIISFEMSSVSNNKKKLCILDVQQTDTSDDCEQKAGIFH